MENKQHALTEAFLLVDRLSTDLESNVCDFADFFSPVHDKTSLHLLEEAKKLFSDIQNNISALASALREYENLLKV